MLITSAAQDCRLPPGPESRDGAAPPDDVLAALLHAGSRGSSRWQQLTLLDHISQARLLRYKPQACST
jgi:hypothetical protein